MSPRREAVTGPCEIGGRGCTGRGRRMSDPYAAQVDGVDEEITACDPCADARADDA